MDKIRLSHGQLERFMHQQIAERKEELRGTDDDGQRADVFSHMIRANEAEEGSKLTLQDSELVRVLSCLVKFYTQLDLHS